MPRVLRASQEGLPVGSIIRTSRGPRVTVSEGRNVSPGVFEYEVNEPDVQPPQTKTFWQMVKGAFGIDEWVD